MIKRKVNLFLVGAMKAGTTKLVDVLKDCPEIFVPPIKEPNYFVEETPSILYAPSKYFNIEKYFNEDFPEPLHIAHIKSSKQYEQLYSQVRRQKYLLDASTMYLHAPDAAARIQEYNPEAKILILTRDPMQRTFSHYRMLVGLNREVRSFEKLINLELKQFELDDLPWYSCLNMSLYKKSIDEYTSRFKDVFIMDFNDWIKCPEEGGLTPLFNFLDIDVPNYASKSQKIVNPTRTLRFPYLFFILNRLGIRDVFSELVPNSLKMKLFKLFSSNEKPSMAISDNLRFKLESIFKNNAF